MPWIIGGALMGSAALGYFGAKDQTEAQVGMTREQMDWQSDESKIQRAWASSEASNVRSFQREMSDTAVSRRLKDLKAAGINPILAGKYDASSPAGAALAGSSVGSVGLPSLPNKLASAAEAARLVQNLRLTKAQVEKTKEETKRTREQTDIYGVVANFAQLLENTVDAIAGEDQPQDIPYSIRRSYQQGKEAERIREQKGIELKGNTQARGKYRKLEGVKNKDRKAFPFERGSQGTYYPRR